MRETPFFCSRTWRHTAVLWLLLCAPGASSSEAKPSLDQVLSHAVSEHYASLHDCFSKLLAVDRQRQGTVFLRVTLGQGGRIAAAKVEHDELGDPRLVRCLTASVRSWRLAGVQATGAREGEQLILPLTFTADLQQQAVHRDDVPAEARGTAGAIYALLTPQNVGAKEASLSLLTLARGKLTLPARPGSTQALYVLSGQGGLQEKAHTRSWRLEAGEAVGLPASGTFALSGTLAVLWLVLPADPAEKVVPAPSPKPVLVRRSAVKPRRSATGVTSWPLLAAAQSAKKYYLGLLQLQRGALPPVHVQSDFAELLYILQGRGELRLGQRKIALRPGLALYFPPGCQHQLRLEKTLRAVQFFAPAAGTKSHRPPSALENPHEPD